jgi:hypothetical protein
VFYILYEAPESSRCGVLPLERADTVINELIDDPPSGFACMPAAILSLAFQTGALALLSARPAHIDYAIHHGGLSILSMKV